MAYSWQDVHAIKNVWDQPASDGATNRVESRLFQPQAIAMRPKSTGRDLPPRMLRRTRKRANGSVDYYFYNGKDESGNRVEIPLGSDLNEAKRKWANLECVKAPENTSLMSYIFERYIREVMPLKALSTQNLNHRELKFLRAVFDSAPVDAITPQHIAQYRDKRTAKVRANREIALLSHVFNYAREWGYTAKENPCRGVRKNKETPRDYYADDEVYHAVYAQAREELQDAMELAYLSAQRPADVLKMRFSDIKEGALELRQNKTSKKLRIRLENDDGTKTSLGLLIDRIKARPISSLFVIATPKGKRVNGDMLDYRFVEAREEAASAAEAEGNPDLATRIRQFQFRDLRPKAASETSLRHASDMLCHSNQEITRKVYRRRGALVNPTK